MNASELRIKFLEFFRQKGHAVIPSASLVPENDPSVLFTTAGMHPLVPYLLGEPHPSGNRLANVQKCLRTGDIDEVGDNTHLTFFEMLGNWSLGDYFKKEAIPWSWEFLTSSSWLNIHPDRLAVSVFAGNDAAPRDEESANLWMSVGVPKERIAYLGVDDNWWPAGGKHLGPQGPDTEMFYWVGELPAPNVFEPGEKRWVEIWNDVFMQFAKDTDGILKPLAKQNVDTGMGLERTLAMLGGFDSVYETDVFRPILHTIETLARKTRQQDVTTMRSMRIIADHVRSAVFILGDAYGVVPSNVDQGYVLRRLIRRAIRHGRQLGIHDMFLVQVADVVVRLMRDVYPELETNHTRIVDELLREEEKFSQTLENGLRELEKMMSARSLSGEDAFVLYATYGFPLELTEELAREKGQMIDKDAFNREFQKHQKLSRAGAEQKFAGGLADHSAEVVRLHTATHLLHQALRTVLGPHVFQRGSNITKERLRFDFSHPKRLTQQEIQRVEAIVNENIQRNMPIHFEILDLQDAKRRGAIGLFEDRYAELGGKIKVYFIGDQATGEYFSREVCGGPHVERTGELGSFSILKEEAVSAGVRRIKATVASPYGS